MEKTKNFRDLIVGDTLYVTTKDLDLFKIKIAEIKNMPDGGRIFYFDEEGDYFKLNSGFQNYEDCYKFVSVIDYNLDSFVQIYENNTYWADREQCAENIGLLAKHLQSNLDKINKVSYKWVLTTNCAFGEEVINYNSKNEYEDKNCCYNNMRKNAMENVESFSNNELIDGKNVKFEFKEDAIWVDVGEDVRFTYNIIEC